MLSTKTRVLIIDNIGMLSGLYKYGEIAYVGGGFGNGIHNILEPATFGIPILFGPAFSKFQEAVDLVKLGAAFPVKNYKELKNNLDQLIDTPEKLAKSGEIAGNYVKNNCGATKLIVDNFLNI